MRLHTLKNAEIQATAPIAF